MCVHDEYFFYVHRHLCTFARSNNNCVYCDIEEMRYMNSILKFFFYFVRSIIFRCECSDYKGFILISYGKYVWMFCLITTYVAMILINGSNSWLVFRFDLWQLDLKTGIGLNFLTRVALFGMTVNFPIKSDLKDLYLFINASFNSALLFRFLKIDTEWWDF